MNIINIRVRISEFFFGLKGFGLVRVHCVRVHCIMSHRGCGYGGGGGGGGGAESPQYLTFNIISDSEPPNKGQHRTNISPGH